MQNLEKRVTQMERTAQKEETTIIVRFVEPSKLGGEVTGLESHGGGQSWSRTTGESEADFIQRASKEAQRNKGFAALLIQTFAEDSHAKA